MGMNLNEELLAEKAEHRDQLQGLLARFRSVEACLDDVCHLAGRLPEGGVAENVLRAAERAADKASTARVEWAERNLRFWRKQRGTPDDDDDADAQEEEGNDIIMSEDVPEDDASEDEENHSATAASSPSNRCFVSKFIRDGLEGWSLLGKFLWSKLKSQF